MACCLFGAKPLSEPQLTDYWLDPRKDILVKFESKYYDFKEKELENIICKMISWSTKDFNIFKFSATPKVNVYLV